MYNNPVRRKIHLLFFAFCIICFSCDKDECNDRDFFPISETVLTSIPYTDGQILQFETSQQETFQVSVSRDLSISVPDKPAVCDEVLDIKLLEDGNDLEFVQFVQRGTTMEDDYIELSLSSYRNNRANVIHIKLDSDGSMSHYFPLNGTSEFHNSIQFMDKTYTNVVELNYDELTEAEDIIQFYYNTEFGIIQYTTNDGLIVNRLD